MMKDSLIEKLSGTDLPEASTFMKPAETRLLERLEKDFFLDADDKLKIMISLNRFKKTYEHYIYLWATTQSSLKGDQRFVTEDIFTQIEHNLERDSGSCFSSANFFGKLRFLLHACRLLGIGREEVEVYMEWVLDFPITPRNSIKELLEEDIFPANLPHVYMHMASGFVRKQIVDIGRDHKEIRKLFRQFLRELRIKDSHDRWFHRKLPGSYGSRQ